MLSEEQINAAIRLAELWTIRELDPLTYGTRRLGEEKEDIYSKFGANDEFMNEALRLHHMQLK